MKCSLPPIAAAALGLAACAPATEPETMPEAPKPEAATCQAEPGQAFVGQTASAEIGEQLLQATGARQLRWVPPRTAVTMDFRPDRLTVSYDDDLKITRVSCT